MQDCILCSKIDHEVIFAYNEPDQYEKIVGVESNGYFRHWVRCSGCGFVYSIYSREKDRLDEIYKSEYRGGNNPWRSTTNEALFTKIISLPDTESETKFRVHWIKDKILEIKKYGFLQINTVSPYTALDIGGGTGVFAYEFRDVDWDVTIIDPDRNAIFLTEKYGINIIQDYYQPTLFAEPFDLISLNFVLEHVLSPEKLLKDVHQNMKSDSLLYIEVPDNLCFKFKPQSDDIYNSCHLWMFSPTTLSSLLDMCGFEMYAMSRAITKRGHYSMMSLSAKK